MAQRVPPPQIVIMLGKDMSPNLNVVFPPLILHFNHCPQCSLPVGGGEFGGGLCRCV